MDTAQELASQPLQGPIEPPKGLTEGRNCHYVHPSGRHIAAIITDVEDRGLAIVSLVAFDPLAQTNGHRRGVTYDPLNFARDTWHYPEYVE